MTDFEKLRADALNLPEEKLRRRAEDDIGLIFPETMQVDEIRAKIADWFKSYDALTRMKRTERGVAGETPYMTSADLKK